MWNSWGWTPDAPYGGPPSWAENVDGAGVCEAFPYSGAGSSSSAMPPAPQVRHGGHHGGHHSGHPSAHGAHGAHGHGGHQGGHGGHGPDVADEPQIQWWVDKIDAGNSIGPCKSRSVGSMCPTNLGKAQTLRVSDRKDTGQRGPGRAKFTCQSLIPDVPRPLRHPSEIGVAMALCDLEKSQALQGDEIRRILRESFHKAYEAVNKAAKAHEDLCQRTEKLKGIPGTLEAVKRAKICTRDVLLWRWFGLTAWIYNQAESEFFQSYGREIESQLMNSVVKIRQRLMQDLMRKPCWRKLERKLVHCAVTDSWTPELQGLLNRFRFMFESLGGPRNPVLQEWRLSEEEEKKLEMEELCASKEREAEQEFEAEVWNNAGRKVSESVVGLLGLDDFDEIDDYDPVLDPHFHADTPLDTLDAFDKVEGNPASIAGQGFVDTYSAIQNMFWDMQNPRGQGCQGQVPLPAFS